MAMAELMKIRGVGRITADKLNKAGMTTVEAVADATIASLAETTGFGDTRANAIKENAKVLMATAPLVATQPTIARAPKTANVTSPKAAQSTKAMEEKAETATVAQAPGEEVAEPAAVKGEGKTKKRAKGKGKGQAKAKKKGSKKKDEAKKSKAKKKGSKKKDGAKKSKAKKKSSKKK